uniref:Uncharacterized protein AlNc14C44G3638 n=1 Tax=Albugo laibachii Nc14 TaxID=890382 RepID=F0WAA9_9STRA|nr:conserved hypothetical protein [Albugo laibachii Nc14]|eukprot:CCA18079.1 conserved hypothetical protein [Albugo laibachii Nc14]
MSAKNEGIKLKLKLPVDVLPSPQFFDTKKDKKKHSNLLRAKSGAAASIDISKLLLGAQGAIKLKELLSTAPDPGEAILQFQDSYSIPPLHSSRNLTIRKNDTQEASKCASEYPEGITGAESRANAFNRQPLLSAIHLLSLLQVSKSEAYTFLLQSLLHELQLRITQLDEQQLQSLLDKTFPYIEFRELRSLVIAILSRQEHTPSIFLHQLTENQKLLAELPVVVRRKIMHVDTNQWKEFVATTTAEYFDEWNMLLLTRCSQKHNQTQTLFEMAQYVESLCLDTTNASDSNGGSRLVSRKMHFTLEERRKSSKALSQLMDMIADSKQLYFDTLKIWKEHIKNAKFPGKNTHSKISVESYPFFGAMRFDVSSLNRDKLGAKADPIHKFTWNLDRVLRNLTDDARIDEQQWLEIQNSIRELKVEESQNSQKTRTNNYTNYFDEDDYFELVRSAPVPSSMTSVIEKIAKLDHHRIFADPVPETVPNYRKTIQNPMDLSTMRGKAEGGDYQSAKSFRDDFNLMIQNCLSFNPETTIYYKEGKRIGKRGNELIDRNIQVMEGTPLRFKVSKRRKVSGTFSGEQTALQILSSCAIHDQDISVNIGMVGEQNCEQSLFDIAMVMCDPFVRNTLCETIFREINRCWQHKQLPTDSLICRSCIQLLQLGNTATLRRKQRKHDYQVRAPSVVIMRVFLPLIARIIRTQDWAKCDRASESTGSTSIDLMNVNLWYPLLHSSPTIRDVSKRFIVHLIQKKFNYDVGATILNHLVQIDGRAVVSDRFFLCTIRIIITQAVAAFAGLATYVNDASITEESSLTSACSVRCSKIWKVFVDEFYIRVLKDLLPHSITTLEKSLAAINTTSAHGEKMANEDCENMLFDLYGFFEQITIFFADIFISKSTSIQWDAAFVSEYIHHTLGFLKSCWHEDLHYNRLWQSKTFKVCRDSFEGIFAAYPSINIDTM